jgi:hypothetical protein
MNNGGIMATEINPSVVLAQPMPKELSIRGAASGKAPPNELRKKVLPAKTLAT